MTSLIPLDDRMIVRPAEAEEMMNGFYLPDSSKKKPQRGEVLAVGSGWYTASGEFITPTIAVGDTVVYSEYAGTEFKDAAGEELLILGSRDVLAILT